MKLTHVLGDTWCLEGKEFVPLYRLPENKCILLDSGLIAEREDMDQTLADNGLTPVGVLGSHTHVDHWGNALFLREKYGARLALPQGEAAIAVYPSLLRGLYGSLSPELFYQYYGHMLGEVDQVLGPLDGPVEFCGALFRIFHAPGHSPDQVCIATPDGVCYLGDALFTPAFVRKGKLPYHGEHDKARASMEKLRGLKCPVYVAAHKGLIYDINEAVDANLARLDEVADWILSLLEGTMEFDQICHRALDQLELFTAQPTKAAIYSRNVRCFLDWLRDTGRVAIQVERGVTCYRRA